MNKSVTIDIWETIIGEKDFSSFSKNRKEINVIMLMIIYLNFQIKSIIQKLL